MTFLIQLRFFANQLPKSVSTFFITFGLLFGAADLFGQSNLQDAYSIQPSGHASPANPALPNSQMLNPMYVNPQFAPWQNPGPYPHFYDPTMMPAEHTDLDENQRVDDFAKRAASLARAGYPLSISKRAINTYGSDYQGYYVGGGVPNGRRRTRGEPRYLNEGTWGMDYAPFFTRVASNWSHGRLFQGGIGQYEPDEKNRPFGQTFGKFFGNKERRFESQQSPAQSSHIGSTESR